MRTMLCGLVVLPLAAAAGQPDRPEDLVKYAVAAAGGAEVLKKYPAGRVMGKGTMSFAGVETPLTFEQLYHVPGRFRTAVRCEVRGQKWELVQVVTKADQVQVNAASEIEQMNPTAAPAGESDNA